VYGLVRFFYCNNVELTCPDDDGFAVISGLRFCLHDFRSAEDDELPLQVVLEQLVFVIRDVDLVLKKID
jgi:hypothetical protein